MNIKFHLFFITLLAMYIISKDQRKYNMQHCKIKEEFSKANTVYISAPSSIEKASGPYPLPGLDVGGEVEVVGFDFTESTKAESTFF